MYMAELTPEARERIGRGLVNHPGYVELVKRLADVANEWRAAHPQARLKFHEENVKATFLTGDLGGAYTRGYFADSEDADALLVYMDERTGKKASLMQAIFALSYLGWVTGPGVRR